MNLYCDCSGRTSEVKRNIGNQQATLSVIRFSSHGEGYRSNKADVDSSRLGHGAKSILCGK